MEFNFELTTVCFSGTVSYIHNDTFLGQSWWTMLPCVKNISEEECFEPSSPKGAKGLSMLLKKEMMLRKSPQRVCNTTVLQSKIPDFNDRDRYLIGKVCKEESSIHKY